MMCNEQDQLFNAMAQRLVDLDGRVYLAQQAYAGQVPKPPHLIEIQDCVRQMIQYLQSIPRSEHASADSAT
ncbi:MAG: hypothetical protein ETSY1_38305 [Candidatus Entotheonella factor]|uniref:Uncharacterized protein n=1 Tax=Entotheonella factor TaxID=1429438 RepID=W4L6W6_ENTF1|nr:hypothetical protein [Candidatus Entotheonella palauensis]ETW93654.1 MAG: hypothetical protein ETSY1_38305 [Candidatus Entotheonella factor]